MSCFSCCEEDDINKHADGGNQHPFKSSAGNSTWSILMHSCLACMYQSTLMFSTRVFPMIALF